MAKYSAIGKKSAAAANTSVLSLTAPASGMRRGKLYDILFGSEGSAPADNAFDWEVLRCSTAGTATAATPNPLDPADAAAVTVGGQAHSAEPTTGVSILDWPMNQRASTRWVASPGSELVFPATASNGFTIRTKVAGGAVAVTATGFVDEQ